MQQTGDSFAGVCRQLSASNAELAIIRAFAAQPFPTVGVHPYSRVDFDKDKLLGDPRRWITLPEATRREKGEESESKRLVANRSVRIARKPRFRCSLGKTEQIIMPSAMPATILGLQTGV
jgi:hypothetical protein